MEKIITFLGNIYIVFGFIVGGISYYYLFRQYKLYYLSGTTKNNKSKKNHSVQIKSNITQYIDSDAVNKEINSPTLILLNTKKQKSIRLVEDRTIIGRSKTDDIVINDKKVSRSHFVITKTNKQYYLKLSAVKNPILLNDKKLTEKGEKLKNGDIISLVNANISFEFSLPNG